MVERGWLINDRVQKVKGYRFPGIIVGKAATLADKTRYVVEADHPEFAGMLHIYAGDQLEWRRELVGVPVTRWQYEALRDELARLLPVTDESYPILEGVLQRHLALLK